jgi:hypothetical protein
MFTNHANFKAVVFLLLLAFAVESVICLSASPALGANKVPGQQFSDDNLIKPQHLYAPHWTNEESFSTTLYLRNTHIERAVTAKISLILDHKILNLSPKQIDPLQTLAIGVAEALAKNNEKAEQSGSASIEFESESAGQINAYAQVLDTARSLSFSFPFMQDGAKVPGALEAVAWLYNRDTDVFIAFQNTTSQMARTVTTLIVSGRAISLGANKVKPNAGLIIKLPALEELGIKDALRSVGVRVECGESPGTIVAQGWAINKQIGFSLPFTFHHKTSCNCTNDIQHQYGAGIMIGAGGMSGAHAGSGVSPVFSPFLVARNTSSKPLTVSPVFSYDAATKTEKVALPEFTLAPQDSAVINLRSFQDSGIIPPNVEMGDIDLQYTDESGSLVAELASVDQLGSFVSPVPLICKGNRDFSMSFWRTDAGWESSITIENVSDVENEVEITVSYPGGAYVLEKNISAGTTAMVSINELQQTQQPDTLSHVIPKEASMGGANIWSRNVRDGLVINAMLINPSTKTCTTCNGTAYASYTSLTESYSLGGFETHAVGDNFGLRIAVIWTDGHKDFDSASSVTNQNPSVATFDGGTGITCIGPGQAYFTAFTTNTWPLDIYCSHWDRMFANGGFAVIRVTFQKADGTGLPSPLRLGITATALDGVTVHDRTQHLRLLVEPSNYVSSITITPSSKVQVSNISASGSFKTFDAVGLTKSSSKGDSNIKAKHNGKTLATLSVSVVVPAKVATPHDTAGGGPFIANMVLDATTSPAIIGLGTGQVRLATYYARYLTITVKDQFNPGDPVGDIYPDAEVSELATDGSYHSINQPLTASSTYSDPVGALVGSHDVAAGSPAAISWPTQPRVSFPAGSPCPSSLQNLLVKVDGFSLSPSVSNRTVTICGDGVSTTSPPVTITITWP